MVCLRADEHLRVRLCAAMGAVRWHGQRRAMGRADMLYPWVCVHEPQHILFPVHAVFHPVATFVFHPSSHTCANACVEISSTPTCIGALVCSRCNTDVGTEFSAHPSNCRISNVSECGERAADVCTALATVWW